MRSLAAARIGLGFFIILDCIFRLQNFTAHYTNLGVLPFRGLNLSPSSVCLQCNDFTAWVNISIFLIQILAGLGLALGWRTKVMTVASWVLMVSLHNRNPLILDGGDVLFRCFLFWFIFLPTGRVWSIDSRKLPSASEFTLKSFSLVTLPLQLFIVYFSSAILKTGADWWPDGTATGYALSLDQFVTPFGHWLTGFPNSLIIVSRIVFIIELWGGFLLLLQGHYRTTGVFLFVAFHIGLAAGLDLGIFPWVAACCLISILPTEFWNLLAKKSTVGFYPLSIQQKNITWAAIPFMAMVVGWNVSNYNKRPYPNYLRQTAIFLHLDQHWGMFAPYPLKDSGWFEFAIETWRGDEQYVFINSAMENEWDFQKTRPLQTSKYFIDQRWRKYLVNLWERDNSKYRPGLARYLCRKWNSDNNLPSDRATKVRMDFELSQNKTYLAPSRSPSSIDLGTFDCPENL